MPEELIPIVLFVSIAAVMILRPLTERLGLVIENHFKSKAIPGDARDAIHRLTSAVEGMADRLERLEDRVDFAERMLDARPWGAAEVAGVKGATTAADRVTMPSTDHSTDQPTGP